MELSCDQELNFHIFRKLQQNLVTQQKNTVNRPECELVNYTSTFTKSQTSSLSFHFFLQVHPPHIFISLPSNWRPLCCQLHNKLETKRPTVRLSAAAREQADTHGPNAVITARLLAALGLLLHKSKYFRSIWFCENPSICLLLFNDCLELRHWMETELTIMSKNRQP